MPLNVTAFPRQLADYNSQSIVLNPAIDAAGNPAKLGFFGVAAVPQPVPSANVSTPTAGSGTPVYTNTTFDGGIGTAAYTVGDLVAALKQYGMLAANPTALPVSFSAAPTLNYPSPIAANPTTIVVHIPVDWQTGDTLKLARSSSVAMANPIVLAHTITDADVTAGSFSIGLSGVTLSGITYFQAYGNHSGIDSGAVSNIVTWGDTVAPTITTSASQSIVETLPLAVTLAATDTGGVPAQVATSSTAPGWFIAGGVDQLQFQIAIVAGVPTLEWVNNGSQSYSSPLDQAKANTYKVNITATDYGGNVSTALAMTVTVSQANLTPTGFSSWPNVTNASLSQTYTAANTWTVAGMSAGVNATLTATGPIRVSTDGGATWTAWGSPPSTVQNGAQIQARDASSSSYSTATSNSVTVGTVTIPFQVTTQADPNAASFIASTNQPAPINNAYGASVWTFTGVDFNVGGYGVVFLFLRDSLTVSSVVIKGAGTAGADISLVQRAAQSSGQPMQVWTAPAGSTIVNGASQNVVVTTTANGSVAGIMSGSLINSSSPVPTATAVTNFAANASPVTTAAITVPASGLGIAFWAMNSTSPYTTSSGTLLGTYVNQLDSATNGVITRQIIGGSWTPSLSYTSTQAANGGIALAWSH